LGCSAAHYNIDNARNGDIIEKDTKKAKQHWELGVSKIQNLAILENDSGNVDFPEKL